MLFMGILGGSLAQNLGGALGFNYMQFVLTGMIVNTLYQMTIGGVASLVEDRENDFTQEMFVSPISRYAIITGKIIGSSMISLFQLVGVFAVALILRIPLGGMDVVRLLLVTPIFCLAGGALGTCFIGFVRDPKVAGMGSLLLVFPQMFLSGVLIPLRHASGLLAILTYIMPMTYSVDLARAVFYWGNAEYSRIVLYNPLLDLAVTAAFFAVFSIVGTALFTKAEQYR
jgi:ABC-2 type transport system permease protein